MSKLLERMENEIQNNENTLFTKVSKEEAEKIDKTIHNTLIELISKR